MSAEMMVAKVIDDELQDRTCRACSQVYQYPVAKSLASRFYCEDCMQLPPPVRATFEVFNKRLKQLASSIDKLQVRLDQGVPSRGPETRDTAVPQVPAPATAPAPDGEHQ